MKPQLKSPSTDYNESFTGTETSMALPEIKVINHHHLCLGDNEYIGRGSPLGNPFSHRDNTKAKHKVETRDDAIKAYAVWLMDRLQEGNQEVISELDRLATIAMSTGKLNLRCYCAPKACHGDVIRKVLLEAIDDSTSLNG